MDDAEVEKIVNFGHKVSDCLAVLSTNSDVKKLPGISLSMFVIVCFKIIRIKP